MSACTIRWLSASAIVAVIFAGNSSHGQTPPPTDPADAQSVLRKFDACQLAVFNAPEFDPVRPHIPRNVFQATPEQLDDTNLATDEEIRAVLLLHPRSRVCYDELLSGLSRSAPLLAAIYATYLAKTQASLIDLLQRQQSWGAYLRGSKDASIARRTAQAESPGVTADVAQQQDALSDALTRFLQVEAKFDSLRAP